MRDHAIVSPKFWTGETGRFLRKHPDAQRLALYLLTCPSSNMIGLYYLPIPTICHELSMTPEGASKALRRVSEGGFAAYDEVAEVVFVFEMARFQVGERLAPKDNRIKAVERQLETFAKSRFYKDFLNRYAEPYGLSSRSPFEGGRKPPPTPLRSQDQDQDQEDYLSSRGSDDVAHPPSDDEKKDKPAKKKETPVPDTVHHQSIAVFCDLWKNRYGQKYPFNAGKDGASIKLILKHLDGDLDQFKLIAQRYFDTDDPFVLQARHTLALLQSQLAKWLVDPTKKVGPNPRPRSAREADDDFTAQMFTDAFGGEPL